MRTNCVGIMVFVISLSACGSDDSKPGQEPEPEPGTVTIDCGPIELNRCKELATACLEDYCREDTCGQCVQACVFGLEDCSNGAEMLAFEWFCDEYSRGGVAWQCPGAES